MEAKEVWCASVDAVDIASCFAMVAVVVTFLSGLEPQPPPEMMKIPSTLAAYKNDEQIQGDDWQCGDWVAPASS